MFPSFLQLRSHLEAIIKDKTRQGHETGGLSARLDDLPDSFDGLYAFALLLAGLPLRDGWEYVEPNDWPGIRAELHPGRPVGAIRPITAAEARERVQAAFLGSVVGCMLGKPIEINPTLDEIEAALTPLGEWPINDYLTQAAAHNFPRGPHPDWQDTVRESLRLVAPDDDINYTLLGMLALEEHGPNFTRQQLLRSWFKMLPSGFTWGPERATLAKVTLSSLPFAEPDPSDETLEEWASVLNPHDEFCGALIRADAYGYAYPGEPERAAELAWRDSSLTHRRTGIYGAMFAAAAISAAFTAKNPLEIFEIAIQFVPQRSRFYAIVSDSLLQVRASKTWREGYDRIHGRYRQYSHCHVYQECGTLINTLAFAQNVGHGVCLQVMQGNDTDSFGATAGSILGAYFGPGHLEARWLEPFSDEVNTRLAGFRERSLSRLTERISLLPALVKQAGTTQLEGVK